MQKIRLPDGQILQFPDGMSDDEMASAISENFPEFAPKEAAAPAASQAPAAAPAPAAAASSGILDTVSGWYGQAKKAIVNTQQVDPATVDGPAPAQAQAPDPDAARKYGVMAGTDGMKAGPDLSDLPVTPAYLRAMKAQWDAATPEQRLELANRKDHLGIMAQRLNAANPGLLPKQKTGDTLGVMGGDRVQLDTTAAADMIDTTAEARARRIKRNGMDGAMADGTARVAAARGILPGQEAGLDSATVSNFDFDTYRKFNEDPLWSNPAVRGAVKGYEGYKQGILGIDQAIGETLGLDVGGAVGMAKDSRAYTDAMGESSDYLQRQFEGTISSIAQQLPALIGGAATGSEGLVLGSMFASTFGQEYSDSRAKGQDQGAALTRAGLFGAFEVVGEKFGLGERLKMLRDAAHGVDTPVLAKWMANTLREELPGEMVTTTGQFLVDKEQNVGMAQDAGWEQYLQQMGDTVTQTIMQGGVMSAGVGGVQHARQYLGGQMDRTAESDANAAQRDALSAWRTNGLSPSSRPASTARREPTWGQAAAGAPAARAEPSIADIGAATSVDDAIAAATAAAAAPTSSARPNNPAFPTAAEIDALEEQAGLTATHTLDEHQGVHDHLMNEMQARAAEVAGKRPAETPPADLPEGPEAAPAAGLAGKESEDPADWHPFPPESRTLGVPRAQMPQIRAEHRGAMTQFLNARGISHEEVEVEAHDLKPTQREFSISKVQKAIEYQGGNRAILISSDGYVLDGHHQWLAAAEKGEPIRAIRLNAPIKQLVKTVHQFPSATVDTSSAGAAPADAGRPLSAYEQGQQRIQKQEEAVRQAAERQAAHRAGQAPQEPGSSVPTAAERDDPDLAHRKELIRERLRDGLKISLNTQGDGSAAVSAGLRAGDPIPIELTKEERKALKLARADYELADTHEEREAARTAEQVAIRPAVDRMLNTQATAAERAPVTPMPAPKPTAGQRMRERVKRDNPFLAFLATHGLHIDERSDTGGQKGRAGGVIVPGFGGSLYRKSGKRLDELATLAHEAGFLTDDHINDPTDTGGTRKLADMIERAVHSKQVIDAPGLLDAAGPTGDQRLIEEAERLGIDTAGKTGDQLYDAVRAAHAHENTRRETSGASTHDEQDIVDHYDSQIPQQELDDADIPFDINDPRLTSTNNLTDEQIDALFGIEKAASPPADRGETESNAAGNPREGAAPAGEPGEQGQDLLTSYTAGDVLEREDAATARDKAIQAERDKLEARRKAEQDAKENRARADASVDDFQLGQDAHAQLSGQRGMFDEPTPAPAAAAAGTTPQPDAKGYIYGVQHVTGGSKSTTKREMQEAKSWGYTEDNVPLSKRDSGWMIAGTFKHIEQPVVDFENGDVTFKILVAQAPNGKWAAGAHYFATGFGGSSHPPMFGQGQYNTREDAVRGGADEIKKHLASVPGIDQMVDGEVREALRQGEAKQGPADDKPMGYYGDADKPLRFASGMSAPKDYADMFAAGGNVGITITELSDKSIPAIAKAMVGAPRAAHLFVDSGAFSVFRSNLKAKETGQLGFDDILAEFAPGGKALDFNKILDRYHALESAISKADDRGYTNDRAFFVMPDVVGNQAESIALAKKYADYINGQGLRAIVPLQSGELSLTQAYEAVMRNLGKDPSDLSPVLGIPSNEAAASDEEFLELMKKYGDSIMGVHILGAAQEATLQPRLDVLKKASYDGNVSADANLLRSFMYGDTDRATALRKAAAMVGALQREIEKAKTGGKRAAPEVATQAPAAEPVEETAPTVDTGADIPANFYSTVTVDYARLGGDGKTVTEQLAADKALAQTREDIANIEALLNCMRKG